MYNISIKVNGEEIELSGYPREIISAVLLAMLQTLKAWARSRSGDCVEEIKTDCTLIQ